MPEWLALLLSLLANGLVAVLLYRWGHRRGYAAGYEVALEMSRQIDEILRGDSAGPPRPPFPP